MIEWMGEGWYRIGWSDGGMDFSSNGAVWHDSELDLEDDFEDAMEQATDTHLPYIEYMGDDDEPKEQ